MNRKTTTQSICSQCGTLIEATLHIKDGQVIMHKNCPEHGSEKVLLSTNPERFFDTTYDVAGKRVAVFQTKDTNGCPDDCGFCPAHQQHICTGLIEITGRCNFDCPICFASSLESSDISFTEFKRRLDTLLRAENNNLDVLQISGGEPLVHPRFTEFLEHACGQNIIRVLINTNGSLLLKNSDIYEEIKKLKDKVEIYLQFDGLDDEATKKLRGRSLTKEKRKIIEKLNNDGIKISLTSTIFSENLSEIKNILQWAIDYEHVSGITFQRLAKVGAAAETSLESVLQDQIIAALAETEYFDTEDIIPLPCSHVRCTSLGFLFCIDGTARSLSKYIEYSEHRDILSNRIAFDESVFEYAKKNLASCCSPAIFKLPEEKSEKIKEFFLESRQSKLGNMKILRIVIKNFMDPETFDTDRIKKCCVGVSVEGDRIIPFCAYNNIHRYR